MSANASPSPGALQLRLSEQMQALSLVSETITLRILDLEEPVSYTHLTLPTNREV